ncbi:MAG: hypothetical protein HYW06_09270 [Gemmatimonadetes bacterium]|nr:hypothetical protein [Gemmatimonadota bacterium]MBI2401161.1 hypothetical protein [Gemmatimonadota bacterium]MBI2537128.1 hypothetical protein [Gemmatimonadota bacterium]MBI2616237.1 hypothetical protein [Gemmatimonadota bacterium]MBI3082404.1 hypothetical protein [Gemmatimonadota bacterium]
MKRLLWSLAVVGTLAALPAPSPADAYPVPCADCDAQFPGSGELDSALSYWCKVLSFVTCGVTGVI